jgi:hypothetical protein
MQKYTRMKMDTRAENSIQWKDKLKHFHLNSEKKIYDNGIQSLMQVYQNSCNT